MMVEVDFGAGKGQQGKIRQMVMMIMLIFMMIIITMMISMFD
jgi:predicted nucleic acid-binding Zn ribbon protein